jgi:hypothetical protein
LDFEPSQRTVRLGDAQFNVTVMISTTRALGSFQLDLLCNSSVVTPTHAALGSFLSSTGRVAWSFPPIVETTGQQSRMRFVAYSYGPQAGPTGAGELVIFTLKPVAAGTSDLQLSNVQLMDTSGVNLPSPIVQTGWVTVTQGLSMTRGGP